jgi:hypothetical protein
VENLTWDNYSIKNSPSFVHTIYLLASLLFANTVLLFLGMQIKKKFLAFLLVFELIVIAILFFILGKNSYSAGLLLVSIFILILILLLSKFGQIELKKKWKPLVKILGYFGFSVFIFAFPLLLVNDSGYMINIYLFPFVMAIVISGGYAYYSEHRKQNAAERKLNKRKAKKNSIIIFILSVCILIPIYFGFIQLITNNYNPISSNRFESRLTMFYDFDKVHETGYRQSEEQSQFFAILTKYAYPSEYNCYEPIHPGISNFDSVVENDLSAPFGLIYQFGSMWRLCILLLGGLWGFLLYWVLKQSVCPVSTSNENRLLTSYAVIRLFCISMLAGSGIWLLLSYYGIVPFTGRLIFGLGQDSIGEVFETLFLFTFMGLIAKTTWKKD